MAGLALVGLLALIPLALLLGVSMSVWESWWLFPVWAQLLTPLGVPPVTFWTFAALNILVSALFTAVPQNDYAKDKDAKLAQTTRLVFLTARPVLAYYIIQWMVS